MQAVLTCYRRVVAQMNADGLDQWDAFYPSPEILEGDIASGGMYVLARGNAVIAACTVNGYQDAEYADGAWVCRAPNIAVLHRFCVDPAYAHIGTGRHMLALCEEIAKKTNAAIRLDAFSQNARALRFYERAGYVRRGETHFRKGKFYLYEKTFVI